MTQTENIVEISDIRIDYTLRGTTIHATQGASLKVRQGETVGLVGESGSGKSTIARALLGLLDPERAEIAGGRIVLDGRDVTRMTPEEWVGMRGHPVAMVFQDPLTFLNPIMSVGKQIREAILLHDPEQNIEARLKELLDMVKLPAHVARSYPDELSGGMRQRALLAVALGCRPKLLVADEPTTALDVTTQAEIMELLGELQKSTGMAMLLISHDLDLVATVCERIYVMYSGRTIEWGAAEQIFAAPAHPYTRGLLAAAEGRRQEDGTFVTIPGDPPDLRIEAQGCPFEPRCAVRQPVCSQRMPEATPYGAAAHLVRCFAAEDSQGKERKIVHEL
ncbi:ABC transporter ATP-binding protein [Salipiger sp. P9]|uniref:ABC transporter ATP-binding protein n=1 Tax=Salipiger pentaromativorans TaxID=2943193 RepID=UPI00215837C2|nr:ABC transporter ATP-binding protein [Salipiger pentaromativorans]MCR8549208.1 ABC transporter ATP-binding protein [Salipiger pentaromativorans]